MKEQFKKSAIQHAIIIAIFFAIAIFYSYPILQGNQLSAGDSVHWRAMSEEARAWSQKTGENPLWSNSMFGGMPTYMTYTTGKSNFYLPTQFAIMDWLPVPAFFFLLSMLCFYILMCSWKINRWVGFIAAIAYAFASYNLQIIAAGHNTKMLNIGYLPLALAGMHWVYNKKYWLGAGVALFAITMMISNMMYQIDYYLAIIMVFFGIGYLLQALKENKIKDFVIASLIMLGVGILSVGPSLNLFLVNKEYAKYTMRGGQSEITIGQKEKKTSGGLNKDYAFQWSQGIGETFTLLVPNLYGGGGQTDVGTGSHVYETLTSLGVGEEASTQFSQNADTYWGAQPFVSGPFYFGAVIIFLFVLGLFIIKHNFKWVMVGVAALGIMMSWGKHFSTLNYFLFDHLPYFNNFRTPNMVMVIPGAMLCIIAFWALNELISEKFDAKELINQIKKSVIIVGGLCLLLGVGGRMFLSFKGENDDQIKSRMIQQLGNNEQAGTQLYNAIVEDRPAIAMKDGIRSLAFILLAAAILWLFAQKKLSMKMALAGIGLLISVDLMGIGLRYLNTDNYVPKEDFEAQFNPRPVDLQLKKDTDPYYRVYDITKDPYNEAMQAFHNKCVGGYHPAKMETYQDLINFHLSSGKMNAQVLDMLNTKYILFNGQGQQATIQPNPDACGNAWFVSNVNVVNSANEEMTGMNAENFGDTANVANPWKAKETAIVQQKYWKQGVTSFVKDSSTKIQLTTYGLNNLTFRSSNTNNGFAVFSDIYYPAGWKAFVDGKETDIVKTNYLLRGLFLPAGNHTIEFKFHPDTYFKWYNVSWASSFLILLIVIGGIGFSLKDNFKKEEA